MLVIRLKKGETIDRALKRMKKILDKEGLIKQIRANRYFEKPSEKKRKKAARSRIALSRAVQCSGEGNAGALPFLFYRLPFPVSPK